MRNCLFSTFFLRIDVVFLGAVLLSRILLFAYSWLFCSGCIVSFLFPPVCGSSMVLFLFACFVVHFVHFVVIIYPNCCSSLRELVSLWRSLILFHICSVVSLRGDFLILGMFLVSICYRAASF